jgi:hypothetical protein
VHRKDLVSSSDALGEEVVARSGRLTEIKSDGDAAQLRHALEHVQGPPGFDWNACLADARRLEDTRVRDPQLPPDNRAFAKRLFTKLTRPLVREVLRTQVQFNEALLRGLTHIARQTFEQNYQERLSEYQWRRAMNVRLVQLEEELRALRAGEASTKPRAR